MGFRALYTRERQSIYGHGFTWGGIRATERGVGRRSQWQWDCRRVDELGRAKPRRGGELDRRGRGKAVHYRIPFRGRGEKDSQHGGECPFLGEFSWAVPQTCRGCTGVICSKYQSSSRGLYNRSQMKFRRRFPVYGFYGNYDDPFVGFFPSVGSTETTTILSLAFFRLWVLRKLR